MATNVTYNGVELHNCLTRQWVQEVVYDESGTDMIGHRFGLRFECILHVQNVPSAPVWRGRRVSTNAICSAWPCA